MCRLFGFRSVIQSQVHSSLTGAENALAIQSNQHPDGWGVGYYVSEFPHIVKSSRSAVSCDIFQKLSGVVSSNTVIAHIRKATLGEKNILNTHPFQFGNWVFAHNGNIKNFDEHKDEIKALIAPNFRRFILGKTDSEMIFFLVLSNLEKIQDIHSRDISADTLAKAIYDSVDQITDIVGEYSKIDNAGETETYLTIIMTNGKTMVAHQGGKNLYYSTFKKRCGERDTCPYFEPVCENEATSGKVNHLLFSSEPLSGENIWTKMSIGQVVGVDSDMSLHIL